MANSKSIAGLIGPAVVATTISETVNIHIWAANTAAGVHFNGTVLFVTGLAIVRAHNLWVRGWPVLATLAGWFFYAPGPVQDVLPGTATGRRQTYFRREHGDDAVTCGWHFPDLQGLWSRKELILTSLHWS